MGDGCPLFAMVYQPEERGDVYPEESREKRVFIK
jgi:hypothetical protein